MPYLGCEGGGTSASSPPPPSHQLSLQAKIHEVSSEHEASQIITSITNTRHLIAMDEDGVDRIRSTNHITMLGLQVEVD